MINNKINSKYKIKGLSIIDNSKDADEEFFSDKKNLKNLENIIRESLEINNKYDIEDFDKIKRGQMAFFNYLTNERVRLEKIVQFFTQKIKTKIDYSNTTKELIALKAEEVSELKEILLRKITTDESTLQQNLSSIFNKAYSSTKKV
ncbi:MAG: hypothetical protein HQK49_12300 [Oligoflexia bacterium]|nr:hypothetical protein [Oligoflexia bacterium]